MSILNIPEIKSFLNNTDDLLHQAELARIKGEKLYSGKKLTLSDIGNKILYDIYLRTGDYAKAREEYDRTKRDKNDG